MPVPSDKPVIHGQWKWQKCEVDNGSIYITELLHPVLYSKAFIRGYALTASILADYKRKLH